MKLKLLFFSVAGVVVSAASVVSAQDAGEPSAINPEDLSGRYWVVQQDIFYGQFQNECSLDIQEDGSLELTDYPIPEGYPVSGRVSDDLTQIIIPNGQVIHVNSYNEEEHFWSAMPDDPDTYYNVDLDENIILNLDAGKRRISWTAPLSDDGSRYLRFLMTGRYFADNDTWKVLGYYHSIKVDFFPLNATFSGKKQDGDVGTIDVEHPLYVECDGEQMHVYGLLHMDHSVALNFDLDKENGYVTIADDGFVAEDEDFGMLYMKTPEGEAVSGVCKVEEGQTVIELESFRITDEELYISGGSFPESKLIVPFDIFAQVSGDPEDPEDPEDPKDPEDPEDPKDPENPEGAVASVCDDAPVNVRYYNMQGAEIGAPGRGVTIQISGDKVSKIIR